MACQARAYRGAGNPKWKGGRLISDGYVYIRAPDHPNCTKLGYVLEHRLVMEQHIGRLLLAGEAVHHRDGDTSNNHISNLELFESNGAHSAECHVHRGDDGKFVSPPR